MQPFDDCLRKAARAAFSQGDWDLLMREPETGSAFSKLHSTEETEEFIYCGYERLRVLQQNDAQLSTAGGMCSAGRA